MVVSKINGQDEPQNKLAGDLLANMPDPNKRIMSLLPQNSMALGVGEEAKMSSEELRQELDK